MDPKILSREQNLYMAKLAEQAERYDDMAAHMEALILSSGELSVEERNLFSVACKNTVASRRAAWRIVSSVEQKEEARRNAAAASLIHSYRDRIEAELESVCRNFLSLIESLILSSDGSAESRVFYLKMKGDYYRYLAEFKDGDERKEAADATMEAYEAAQNPTMEAARGELEAAREAAPRAGGLRGSRGRGATAELVDPGSANRRWCAQRR